jgi:LAO/AO transport system kinase
MASRGAGGGLAEQTAAAATVLAAAGFATVLVETVGVGQDELAIAQEAQTTLVVVAPGFGDDVQALKAGVLEVADILVVNKADRDGADRLVAELRFGRGHGQPSPPPSAPPPHSVERGTGGEVASRSWSVPILKTVATTGQGVEALAAAIQEHRTWLAESGAGEERARALAARHILHRAAAQALQQAERRARASGEWEDLVADVASHRRSPAEVAQRLLRETEPASGPSSPNHRPANLHATALPAHSLGGDTGAGGERC